ncbi:MAG: pyrroline-5-carboxylate reductase [Synergistota bacterium]|nr:pyrroline-5-carboxylate reductase [Synergistota bacterium]
MAQIKPIDGIEREELSRLNDVRRKIAVVGAGALGGAVAEGLYLKGQDVMVYDTSAERRLDMGDKGISVADEMDEALAHGEIVFWALKPHIVLSVIESNSDKLSGKLCCSLAACVDLELLKKSASDARWTRAMTNICASVCKAFTGYSLSTEVTEKDKEFLREVLSCIGLAREVSEGDLDGITGISGSGPAYVFTILESFIQGGLASGLKADVSFEAAAMTLIGSAELALRGGEHPAAYKDRVCTPAGTTIDALRVLESGGLRTSIIEAVVTASEKGRSGSRALRKKTVE